MSILVQHKITKIIKKNSIEYLCENHNGTTVSYPSFQSLEKDHPNLEETLIIICDLREISGTHTQSFAEIEN
jgi:hypothetical protein